MTGGAGCHVAGVRDWGVIGGCGRGKSGAKRQTRRRGEAVARSRKVRRSRREQGQGRAGEAGAADDAGGREGRGREARTTQGFIISRYDGTDHAFRQLELQKSPLAQDAVS